MATTYRKKVNGKLQSPYYYAVYYSADRKRVSKSTGLTKKREAQRLATEWELAEIKLSKGKSERETEIQEELKRFIAKQNRSGWKQEETIKMLAKIHEIGSGEKLNIPTLKRYLAEWMLNKKEMVSPSSFDAYTSHISSIASVCGDIGDKQLCELQTADLKKIQNRLAGDIAGRRTTRKTVNLKMVVLKSAIKDAYNEGLITRNIGLAVKPLPEDDSKIKGAFTSDEIQKLIKEAPRHWKGMILFSADTGLRISNLAGLKWKNVDIENRLIKLIQVKHERSKKKTLRTVLYHLLSDTMLNYLKFIGINKTSYVFTDIVSIRRSNRTLHFKSVMEKAGVPTKIEVDYQDEPIERSFHGLRHYYNSKMTNNGVSQDVRKKYTGHKSDSSNVIYTHIDAETIKKELAKVPQTEYDWGVAQ